MEHDGDIESVEDTISSGNERIAASRKMIDDLDRRLVRGSQLLGSDDAGTPESQD